MELRPSFKYVLFIGEKSADLMDWLQMQTCSVYFTKSKNNTCLCTSKLFAKIKCTFPQKDCIQLTATCKMETVAANHDDCFSYHMTDELTGKRTQRNRYTFMYMYYEITLRTKPKMKRHVLESTKRISFKS